MPDRRKHRGAAPRDSELFGADALEPLRAAVAHLSWLLSRGYASTSSLKLVGDRFALTARQRTAVQRCACSDAALRSRTARRLSPEALAGNVLEVDGYNVLTTVEAALAGGVVLVARDGCFRDMASMHGSYRRVAETTPALEHLVACTRDLGLEGCRWLLDRPVSNSGRLKGVIERVAATAGVRWLVQLVPDPDRDLLASPAIVASADSQVLDGCGSWFGLARYTIESRIPDSWLVRLDDDIES